MSRWFRFHDDALNDPKVQRLSGDMFKVWVNILCIASKNDGVLKCVGDVAFGLRVSDTRAGQLVALLARGSPEERLLDPVEGGYFRPHNWDGRQYLTDKKSTPRVKAYRERKMKRGETVSETVPVGVSETDQRQIQSQRQIKPCADEGGPAAAPVPEAREAVIGKEAVELAEKIGGLLGHDADFVPPSFFGAPYRIQSWLNQGWPEPIILASIAEQIARKRGDKPNRIEYFEPGIADAIARQSAPVPTVTSIPGKTIEVNRATATAARSGLAAIDRVFERIASRGAEDQLGGLTIEHEDAVFRLSN